MLIFLVNLTPCFARIIEIPVREVRGLFPFRIVEPARPRLILALSGGGSRGAAHIGVLKVLDEAGIRPDGIAGSSIGSLVGTLYSGGFTPDEITARLAKVDWNSLLLDEPERRSLLMARKAEHSRHLLTLRLGRDLTPVVPGAITPGQKLYHQLLKLTLDLPDNASSATWDSRSTQLRIVATELISGRKVVFDSGDPVLAIRASMSAPLLFEPVQLDSDQLIDGGVSCNIPVETARSMDGEVIVAVDVTADLRGKSSHWQPWEIVDQVTTILEKIPNQHSLDNADLVLSPMISDSSLGLNSSFEQVYSAGISETKSKLDTLRHLLTPDPEPDDFDTLSFIRMSEPETLPEILHLPPAWRIRGWTTVNEIRERLEELYDSGKILSARVIYDEPNHMLILEAQSAPVINSVTVVNGMARFESSQKEIFQNQISDNFDYKKFRNNLKKLIQLYRDAGFPAVNVREVVYSDSDGSLTIGLDQGVLDGVEFSGLEKVSTAWLEREVPLEVGKPVTRTGIIEGMKNLYATGLFRNVYPVLERSIDNTVDPGKPSRWIIRYHVVENPSPLMRLGLAYLDQQRTRGFIELSYPSPFNYATRGVIFTSVGERDQLQRVESNTDKILGMPIAVNIYGIYSYRDRDFRNERHRKTGEYRETYWGGRLEAGGQAWSWGQLLLTGRLERHENRYPVYSESFGISVLGAELGLDTENRSPYPNQGVRLRMTAETAAKEIGSDRRFTKITGHWESFVTPIHRHTLGLRVMGGTVSDDAPMDERLRLGGMHSFPGLQLDELVNSRQLTAGVEYRFDMLSRVFADSYIGFRYDVGSGWDDPSLKIDRLDWNNSVAIYFAFDTLLGPIHLQWARLFGAGGLTNQTLFSIQAGNSF